ncbi:MULTISPECIES: hypothetical protein [unclassified Brenneria]|uniref:hypothetical protein n=1 Tax=unclassified Brenneria TaxID=2634434 RepID=UPI001558209F|nr:hypothetical protein [Brenneria sp. hezel4-2-4]MEE3652494.1 hypothetical protein [Brenneria sp. HEZEL_4_2_4]NPD02450.1 hypothetical protein [Brenneria sp. hezel4-2-4]
MSEGKISLTAGSACAKCNNPDPCLHQITLDAFDDKTHIWPVEQKINLKVLDDGTGCKGTITVEGKCDKPTCPQAALESENEKIAINNGIADPVTLYYKKQSDKTNTDFQMKSIWAHLNSLILPSDAINAPHRYQLVTQGCMGKAVYAQIDVYPTVELRAVIGFSYDLKGKERSWKERRNEQIAARKKMEDTQPKNGNKLRNGWTFQTDRFQITQEQALNIEYGLKICDTEYSSQFAEVTRKVRTVKTLEQIGNVERFVANINKYLLPDPDKKGSTRQYRVFDYSVEPINMGISYAYQCLDGVDETTHFMGLYAAPFLSMKMKIDLIQLLAAYCKIERIAAKCREYIAKGGDSIECYIQLTTALHLSIGAAYKQEVWTFSAGEDNKLGFTLEGVVSVAFKTEVLFVEVSLEASGSMKTKAGFKLDQHDDGIDLVGYHDGIVADVAVVADAQWEKKKGGAKDLNHQYQYQSTTELAAPLKSDKSAMRINLFGKERVITKPKMIPA